MDVDQAVAWYTKESGKYAAFTRLLHLTIERLIRASEIPILGVTSRPKDLGSFREKFVRKEYVEPTASTDLAGVRVISFIEPDAIRIASLVRSSFMVHEAKSIDKSDELGESQVGYRSIHVICEVDEARCESGEFAPYRGLLFETQIRTVLQHAWAEIEHDRGYKFAGVLPAPLRRRLNLVAGQLELADLEFARLADDADEYAQNLRDASLESVLAPSSRALIPFLEALAHDVTPLIVKPSDPDEFAGVLDELYAFDLKTISGVKSLFTPELRKSLRTLGGSTTQIGVTRKAMMFADVDRYFREAWFGRWRGMSLSTQKLIEQKWGAAKLQEIRALLT